jgi:hypothetical protein
MNPSTTASGEPAATLEAPARQYRREPRWPAMLAIFLVLVLLEQMSGRIRLFPGWGPWALGFGMFITVFLVALASDQARWLPFERAVTFVFCGLATAGTIANLENLIAIMVRHGQVIAGQQLLVSAIGVWLVNVLSFSLLYWQVDRGGPGRRGGGGQPRPDFLFPQEGAPAEDVPPGWRPVYVDYLFLAFWTATAFSPTDALPLTPRAKLLMMAESSISLSTIIVVASRAINILGT